MNLYNLHDFFSIDIESNLNYCIVLGYRIIGGGDNHMWIINIDTREKILVNVPGTVFCIK